MATAGDVQSPRGHNPVGVQSRVIPSFVSDLDAKCTVYGLSPARADVAKCNGGGLAAPTAVRQTLQDIKNIKKVRHFCPVK